MIGIVYVHVHIQFSYFFNGPIQLFIDLFREELYISILTHKLLAWFQ